MTNTYTIGSPSGGVNNVTVTPTTGTTGTAQSYTVTFVAVNALATGNTVTIGDSLWQCARRDRSTNVQRRLDLGLVPSVRDRSDHQCAAPAAS